MIQWTSRCVVHVTVTRINRSDDLMCKIHNLICNLHEINAIYLNVVSSAVMAWVFRLKIENKLCHHRV